MSYKDIEAEYPFTNERGERYRVIAPGCREYAPTMNTPIGALPVGEAAYETPAPETVKPEKNCPFTGGLYPHCDERCAFYAGGECRPGTAQEGKRCPFPARLTCGDNCTMYKNGRCGLFRGRKGE